MARSLWNRPSTEAGVHTRLDHLDSDLTPDRLLLKGSEHDPHSPDAELLPDPVGPELAPGADHQVHHGFPITPKKLRG